MRPQHARGTRGQIPAPFSLELDALEPGLRFATAGRTVTEADVVQFAALSWDRHPQHVDAAWAAGSRFGERVAHGMLVLSCAIGLVPLDPARVIALRRVRDAVFKRPARLGDTVHVEGTIDSARPLDQETGLVVTSWRVLDQDDATLARATVEVLWRRDAGDEHDESGQRELRDGDPGRRPEVPAGDGLVVPL